MTPLPLKPRVTPHPDRTDGPLDSPRVIVVHTTEGGESLDSAEGLARFVSGPKQTKPYVNVASYHWVVDADSVIPLAPENVVAYHAAGANGLSIGICITGKTGQTPEQWADDMSAPAVEWAARLCGERAQALGIPLHRLSVAELRAGIPGICGHDDVRAAWNRTTHTDPGAHFPWDRFLALAADQIRPPEPIPPTPEDDLMAPLYFIFPKSKGGGGQVAALDPYSGNIRSVSGQEFYDLLGGNPPGGVKELDAAQWAAIWSSDQVA